MGKGGGCTWDKGIRREVAQGIRGGGGCTWDKGIRREVAQGIRGGGGCTWDKGIRREVAQGIRGGGCTWDKGGGCTRVKGGGAVGGCTRDNGVLGEVAQGIMGGGGGGGRKGAFTWSKKGVLLQRCKLASLCHGHVLQDARLVLLQPTNGKQRVLTQTTRGECDAKKQPRHLFRCSNIPNTNNPTFTTPYPLKTVHGYPTVPTVLACKLIKGITPKICKIPPPSPTFL